MRYQFNSKWFHYSGYANFGNSLTVASLEHQKHSASDMLKHLTAKRLLVHCKLDFTPYYHASAAPFSNFIIKLLNDLP
jgi:hypothetical protein